MNVIEHILNTIAPHACVQCGAEGRLLCLICSQVIAPSSDCCSVCNSPQPDGRTCLECQQDFPLTGVMTCVRYEGSAKRLLHALKYERSAGAAQDIARVIAQRLPPLGPTTLVAHLPTAYSRMRQRGYDQSALIAREVARYKKLPYRPLLYRSGSKRQVGQDRSVRLRQMTGAFLAAPRAYRVQQPVLLIDDVITTGSSAAEAARVLRAAGIPAVQAVAFARA